MEWRARVRDWLEEHVIPFAPDWEVLSSPLPGLPESFFSSCPRLVVVVVPLLLLLLLLNGVFDDCRRTLSTSMVLMKTR